MRAHKVGASPVPCVHIPPSSLYFGHSRDLHNGNSNTLFYNAAC